MSSTGVTIVDTVLLRAIQMPIGMPIAMQKSTDRIVMISRSWLSSHRPNVPKSSMHAVTRIVDRRPANT